MTRPSSIALTVAFSAIALTIATPSLALSTKIKPITISAKIFASPESKLCMPTESVGIKVAKDQPKVLCLTRSDWEAQGIAFKIK